MIDLAHDHCLNQIPIKCSALKTPTCLNFKAASIRLVIRVYFILKSWAATFSEEYRSVNFIDPLL